MVGYILLIVGIVVIFFAVFGMIFVFTGSSGPPKVLNFSDVSYNGTMIVSGSNLNEASGLLVWFVLMAFVMWGGGKIASLGVNLLREIKIEIKGSLRTVEEKEPEKTEPVKTEPAKAGSAGAEPEKVS